VVADKATSDFEDGILIITLPKAADVKPYPIRESLWRTTCRSMNSPALPEEKIELRLSMGAGQADVRCPSGHCRAHWIYAAPPVMFMGRGFYVTDSPLVPSGDANNS